MRYEIFRGIFQPMKSGFAVLLVGGILLGTAFAQTETILYSFAGVPDGASPDATPILDVKGNLYGTTGSGGAHGYGTVWERTAKGVESVLYSFSGPPGDGAVPYTAGVIRDKAGNLYGTTGAGGANNQGTVYKLTPGGTETILHSFAADGKDGVLPIGGLVMDKLGNLYGTTNKGGASNNGTVYMVTASGTETVLHSFAAGKDGCQPYNVTLALKGKTLYGTTAGCGANGQGTVFKITLTGTETVLYSFPGSFFDGFSPDAGVILDKAGNLYGTTAGGGGGGALGTVFELTAKGKEMVLYAFGATETDGYIPVAPVTRDTLGNLYGTTYKGGTGNGCCGTVWKLDTSGKETILHAFTGKPDGGAPFGPGVVLDKKNNLYGTTVGGGVIGAGAVYEIVP